MQINYGKIPQLALCVFCNLLAACTKPASVPPAVEVRTVEVVRTVMRPCPITIPKRPAKLAMPLPTDAVALAATIAAKLAEWSAPGGYGDRADAALTRCASTAP